MQTWSNWSFIWAILKKTDLQFVMWVNVNTSAHSWSFFFLPPVYFIAKFERVFFPNQREILDARWRVTVCIVTLSCSRTMIKHREGPEAQGKEGTVIIEQCWKKNKLIALFCWKFYFCYLMVGREEDPASPTQRSTFLSFLRWHKLQTFNNF